MRRLVLLVALAGCTDAIDADGDQLDPTIDPDPLTIDDPPAPGSLDELHRTIIAPRCSGQPGLCHNGQFEPNLSTPALFYAYVVNRPSLEKPTRYRVKAGDPDASVLIDKLRGRDVASRMPLGADPLTESEIAQFEAWITSGALRAPGDAPPPLLNNPPTRPEIAIYDSGGTRLDLAGPVSVAAGATITLRHSVRDFETADALIPFAAFVLNANDGRSAVIEPAAAPSDRHIGVTAYDGAAPMGVGDLLNYRRSWTIPSLVTLLDPDTGLTEDVAAAGLVLTAICVYVDSATDGIATIAIANAPITLR